MDSQTWAIKIHTPFSFCKNCPFIDVDQTQLLGDGRVAYREFICRDYHRCKTIIGLYEEERRGKNATKEP